MVDTLSPEQIAQDEEGIRFHYDLPADFFHLLLGDSFLYSSGYYRTGTESLEEAQQNKIALYCKKLELGPTDHLLDIGAGWGTLMFYVAQKYGCHVTGLSLSPVQKEFVTARAKELGVEHLIHYDLTHVLAADYPAGHFTRIGSLEATEHVEDLPTLYKRLYPMLADDGLVCIQVITGRADLGEAEFPEVNEATNFMRNYIYPVGRWATISEVVTAMENAGLEIVDVENITDHYYITQQQWTRNLQNDYADKAAETGVTPDRYLAQLLFAAGSVDTFARSTNLDYQVLSRKNGPGARRPLQLDRASLTLDGPERHTLPQLQFTGQVELEITGDTPDDGTAWYVDLAKPDDGIQQGHAPNAIAAVRISQQTVMELMAGETNWPDAFVQGKITHTGSLPAILWVRDSVRGPLGMA